MSIDRINGTIYGFSIGASTVLFIFGSELGVTSMAVTGGLIAAVAAITNYLFGRQSYSSTTSRRPEF